MFRELSCFFPVAVSKVFVQCDIRSTAPRDKVIKAHRNLMLRNHPDNGGKAQCSKRRLELNVVSGVVLARVICARV